MRQRIAVLALALVVGSVCLAVGSGGDQQATVIKQKPAPPQLQTGIHDPGSSLADLLRRLPGVVQVEVAVKAEKPTCRIVHLRDWHFVPRDLFAIDLQNASGKELTDDEIDRRYQDFLREVDAVQLEQMALLRCLIKQLGLKRIYQEGLTPGDVEDHKLMIALLKDTEDEAETEAMIDRHSPLLLKVGAPGRLLIAGDLEEVLPLDNADALENAYPVTEDSKVRLDLAKLRVRHDAQVKAVLAKRGVGLVVLGGGHDLSDSVRRLGQGRCEYVRVTTQRFREFGE